MAINWIKRDEFQKRFETEYLPLKRYLIQSLESETSFAEVCEILPVSLSIDVNDDNGLGECKRWFGVAADNLLLRLTVISICLAK
jgi:hypothetical protein